MGGYLDLNYVATKISKRTIEDSGWGDVNLTCVGIFNGIATTLSITLFQTLNTEWF